MSSLELPDTVLNHSHAFYCWIQFYCSEWTLFQSKAPVCFPLHHQYQPCLPICRLQMWSKEFVSCFQAQTSNCWHSSAAVSETASTQSLNFGINYKFFILYFPFAVPRLHLENLKLLEKWRKWLALCMAKQLQIRSYLLFYSSSFCFFLLFFFFL